MTPSDRVDQSGEDSFPASDPPGWWAGRGRARTSQEPAPTLLDNPAESRLELRIGGELAGWAEYRPAGASVIVAHTEIDPRHEGQGLGSQLVRGTLDHIRANGKTVIPVCPFTAAYISRHPEYVDLVDASVRGQFNRRER